MNMRSIYLALFGITLIGLIAVGNALLTSNNTTIGIVVGSSGIVLGLIYLIFHRRSYRARVQFHEEDEQEVEDRPLKTKAIVLLVIFVSVLIWNVLALGMEGLALAVIIISVIFIPAGLFYFIIKVCTAWTRRRTTNLIVVSQLAAIVRQNLPLATGLALAAESERGAARTHLRRIARLLAKGSSLSEATRRGFPDCPSMPLSFITAGERAGQLPAGLEQAEQYLIDRARRTDRTDISVGPYILIVMFMMLLIISGFMVAVVPKFKEIFMDFEAKMPRSLLLLMGVSEFVVGWGILPLFILFILLTVPFAMYISLRPRRSLDLALTSRVGDWIRWRIPGWRKLELGAGIAAVMQTMRMAVRSGMNLEPAARLAARIDMNNQLRPRVVRFADLLAEGTNVRSAAQQSGLGQITAVALASGERAGDMDAGLRFAADYHDAVVNRFWIILQNLAWPLCTLIMSIVVAFVVIAMFQPLASLIDAVSNTWGH